MKGISLTFCAFSKIKLVEYIHTASGATRDWSHDPPDQVRYLYSYLSHSEMDAHTIVVEHPYTDRHYLAEYQGYYATALRPPSTKTTRLHFFKREISPELATEIANAALEPEMFREVRKRYQSSYLGFVVIRPIESAPIGRTVLRTYAARASRCFGPRPPPHRAHLLGLTLKAHGIQFQEQDRAVGACATAAVSAALAAVIRRDGGRSPTSLSITEHANRSVPEGRVLPAAAGLTRQQMIGAIIASGYSPDVIKPGLDGQSLFLLAIMMYIRSGIPVVMQLYTEGADEGHAVTVVGFRSSDDDESAEDIVASTDGRYALRSKGVSKLYVHDDRLGPYARMRWSMDGKDPTVQFIPYSERFPQLEIPAYVSCVIAPLYPKIRISALDVLHLAGDLLPVVAQMARERRLLVEPVFRLSGDYSEEVLQHPISRERAAFLVQSLLLSRYVAVIRFCLEDDWFLDIVCDATDILRSVPKWGQVLAVIPADEEHLPSLKAYFERKCPNAIVG